MGKNARIGVVAALSLGSMAAGQTTVNYASTGWNDFGTANIVSAAGNFWAGWTTANATPDVGDDLFFYPTDSLSGLPDDAALWLNCFDPGHPSYAATTEVAALSLDGFTIGQTYELNFWLTITHASSLGWNNDSDDLQVGLSGADIGSWSSTVVTDPVDLDGLNDWTAQTLTFTAMTGTVEFRFGEGASSLIGAGVSRFGIDGFRARLVPAPGASAVLVLGGLVASARRRRG